ncbi:TPA: hypothetical protein ACG3KC_003543 [Clostridioides difficile]|uniref:hypothetical protein n=1 Tax=Clostridioides difficile TaxID=1496 RepID=UPI00093B7953|nr:hypothetical protein [Clostridioides difficile]HBF2788649.1 hypothetical protein [Clostridioides difficile]HBF4062487.1 hypothetical protein [Clostridioides difficile]
MGKFEDFDLDLRENKDDNHSEGKAGSSWPCATFISNASLKVCGDITKKNCSKNCNDITKISKCTGR